MLFFQVVVHSQEVDITDEQLVAVVAAAAAVDGCGNGQPVAAPEVQLTPGTATAAIRLPQSTRPISTVDSWTNFVD